MSDEQRSFLERAGVVPDRFQIHAMDALDAGESVLVAAPTGSGKTLIAEYAVHLARSRGRRAFYTAPVKALSNQKYNDLRAVHGDTAVGLLTGDTSLNPEAAILVMTTEVLRNMIYAGSDRLEGLDAVVLDEVHFLQDEYRGPVWEEVIIQLPPEVRLVCLSATVSNAEEVGRWLATVRGATRVVEESRRPVALVAHHAYLDRSSGEVILSDTIVDGRPNEDLRRHLAGPPHRRDRHRGSARPARRFGIPARHDVVDLLCRHEMLPAIVFIFSRMQCETAAAACRDESVDLTTDEEKERITAIVEVRTAGLDAGDRQALRHADFLAQILTGVAAHHAGMLPVYKEAVEECFVRGLVKVVFATETLAVGINMPARAVVIEKLTKFNGKDHVMLRASEYAQLTGRAGRRGLDPLGHSITLWSPWVSFDQTAGLVLNRDYRLASAFRPTFNMAVNMIRRHSRPATAHLLNLSFSQFQSDREVVDAEAVLERKRRERAALGDPVRDPEPNGAPLDPWPGEVEAEISLRALRPGDVVILDTTLARGRALVLATASRRGGTRVSFLTTARRTVEVKAADLRALAVAAARVELPEPYLPGEATFRAEAARRLASAPVDAALTGRPIMPREGPGDPGGGARGRARRLDREIARLEERSAARTGSVVARFDRVTELLERLGYLEGWTLTSRGEVLAGIFHECDLLVVEVLLGGALDRLSVPDLVATVACLVHEPRGADDTPVVWPSDTVRERCARIERIHGKITASMDRSGIAPFRVPHGGLAREAAMWARGAPLSGVIDPDLTPGDFVRAMRQVADLLSQLAVCAPSAEMRATALEAISAINRGVVASGAGA